MEITEIKDAETTALEERKIAIATEIDSDDADLEALEAEVRAINAEIETRRSAEAKKEELRKAVAMGKGEVVDKVEGNKMAEIEIRNTKAYIDAYAEYIKSGDDKEVRALLTENGSGSVPVPELVYNEVKTAWENNDLLKYVKKAYVRGNLKVGFEISSTGAVVATEGVAVDEETLSLGIVNIIPANIKKWISVSDEILDMRGEEFLRYVYAELAQKIAKKMADELISLLKNASTQSTASAVGVAEITATQITQGLIAEASGHLSDEASKPIIVMNKLTYADFKKVQYNGKFATDIFEGYDVVFNNTIKAFSVASTGDAYAYVGDFTNGALANFPNGEELKFNFDDKTLATSDLIRIIGREYVGLGLIAPDSFVRIVM